jgi:hypothetical protein
MTAFNRAGLVAIAVALFSMLPRAQTVDAAAIAAAKAAIAATLAPSLPRVSLETWLRDIARPAIVTWIASDCGEQTGNPALDRRRDVPLCADARLAMASERVLSLSFLVGTRHRGIGGKIALFAGQFIEPDGLRLPVSDLTLVPSFMSETARLEQAQAWMTALRPGMTRADVERRLDHPVEDGGLNEIGHTRYYLGFDIKLDVPFATTTLLSHTPQDRVSGPAVISRGGYAMD